MTTKRAKTRRKGQGSIRERGTGVYELTFILRSGTGAKRRRGFETVKGSRQDAERRLRTILNNVDNGTHITKSKETTADYLRRWLDTYPAINTSPRTAYGYGRIIESQLVPCVGEIPLAELRADDVLAMHRALTERGLSNMTVLHAHRLLAQALSHAVKWQVLATNPCVGVDAPRPRRREMKTLNWQSVQTFFAAVEHSRFRDFYIAAFYLGLRRSEVLALRWPQVDADEALVKVIAGLHRIKGQGRSYFLRRRPYLAVERWRCSKRSSTSFGRSRSGRWNRRCGSAVLSRKRASCSAWPTDVHCRPNRFPASSISSRWLRASTASGSTTSVTR